MILIPTLISILFLIPTSILILFLMLISYNIDFYFVLINVDFDVSISYNFDVSISYNFDVSISYHPLICSVVAKNQLEKNQKKVEKMLEEMSWKEVVENRKKKKKKTLNIASE